MANMEHVQIVKRGRDVVARWRQEHPNEMLDLNTAFLSNVRMPQVNLRGSDIRNSDFMGAMMVKSDLSDCLLNSCHLYHANLTQVSLSRSILDDANLRGANFTNADLSEARLDRAILSDANLTGANLKGANLARTVLTGANLTDADLTGANLNRCAMIRANLTKANLSGADLYEASLHDVILDGTLFAGAILGYSVFQNCDLSVAEGLDQLRHDGPSTLGVDSLLRSRGRIPEAFLQGAGSPGIASFQKTLRDSPPSPGHCFISCLSTDLAIAQQLQADLQAQGVFCWIFADNTRGNPLVDRKSSSDQEEVERWVRHFDKLVVVCSRAALESEVVRKDITEAQGLQQTRDQWVLFLVAPDDAIFQPRHRLARELRGQYVVFDLQDGDSNPKRYQAEVLHLAENLKQDHTAKASMPLA